MTESDNNQVIIRLSATRKRVTEGIVTGKFQKLYHNLLSYQINDYQIICNVKISHIVNDILNWIYHPLLANFGKYKNIMFNPATIIPEISKCTQVSFFFKRMYYSHRLQKVISNL
jgi:hypothetical protein